MIQDLDVVVDTNDGFKITEGNSVEAITWGDLHATIVDPTVIKLSQQMLDTLKLQDAILARCA